MCACMNVELLMYKFVLGRTLYTAASAYYRRARLLDRAFVFVNERRLSDNKVAALPGLE